MLSLFNFTENQEHIVIDLPNKPGNIIKIAGTTNDPYFCGKDVCVILEYEDTKKALQNNVDSDDKKALLEVGESYSPTSKREKSEVFIGKVYDKLSYNDGKAVYVSEAGLYSLVLSSKAKFAKEFKKLVCKQILPSIRKFGEYKIEQRCKKEKDLALELVNKEKELALQLVETQNKQIEQMSEESQRMQRRIKNTKLLMNNIKLKETKLEWIYIATSENYAKDRFFKIGSTERLSKRIGTYNTGRIGKDIFFFCWVKKCYSCKDLDYCIQSMLKQFKCSANKEMYQGIRFEELCDIVNFICENYDSSIDKVNEFIKYKLELSLELQDGPIPRINLKEITTNYGDGITETLDVAELEQADIRDELFSLINSYSKESVTRKQLVSDLENRVSGYDKRSIWGQVKSMLNWKDSKTECVLEDKKIKIIY